MSARCKSCGARVLWARTVKGSKGIPLDPDPEPGGNVKLRRGKDGALEAEVVEARPDVWLHQSHFVTCPQADQWRRR